MIKITVVIKWVLLWLFDFSGILSPGHVEDSIHTTENT